MKKVNTFCKMIRTLEYYGYGEMNAMTTPMRSYKVKVSDKEGNIITVEKDGSLYAMVGLALNGGVLTLLDAAHDNSVLAEVEFPNAGHIENTRFDSANDKILFDITTLNGNVETIELDIQSLVDIYEEGQGIEFKEGSSDGKKTINIKLAEGEDILQLGDEGLSISDKVATDAEVDEKLEGKADKSGLTEVSDEVEKLKRIIGTDVEDPSIQSQIDSINEVLESLEDLPEISGITAELEKKADKETVEELSGKVETLSGEVADLSGLTERVEAVESGLSSLTDVVTELDQRTTSALTDLDERKADKADIEALSGLSGNVADLLAEEARLREEADNELASLISAETADRIACCEDVNEKISNLSSATDTLRSDLNAEIERATNAENVISGRLETERSQREANDVEFLEKLRVEGLTRKAQDEILLDMINNLSSSSTSGITDLTERLEQEILDRIAGDNFLSGAVDTEKDERVRDISANKQLIESGIASVLSSVAEVSDKVDQEAATRASEDADIREALREEISARTSSDGVLHSEIVAEAQVRENADNEINQRITDELANYYTKQETDGRIAEDVAEGVTNAVSQANLYTDGAVASGVTEAKAYTDSRYDGLTSAITKNATDIAMISELKGCENGIEGYDDSGNGILDALHREFHNFERTHGLIKEIKVVDDNLVIVYFTEDGEAESVIPIGDIVDLSDYYTKDEVDALVSGITLDDYYTKEETDAAIESAITGIEDGIQALNDKLGYTDNDTLVTNNEKEVAFGTYNESNTGADSSEKTVFSVGAGSSDAERKNAFEVRENGDLYLWVEGEYMCVNELLGQLAHETYYDDNNGMYDDTNP